MFERFDEGARQVVVLADEQRHNHRAVEMAPIFLLAGVALSRYVSRKGQPWTTGAKVLRSMGMKDYVLTEMVRGARYAREPIRVGFPKGEEQETPSGTVPFTDEARKSLDLALREALSLGHNSIRSEHILLGLVRLGPADVLTAFTELPRANVIRELSRAS